MSKKYQIICADPPYGFRDTLKQSDVKRGAAANYNTMSVDDLADLPIKDLADPKGCILALWVPSSLLPEGLRLMEGYGFKMKQTYIWVKTKKEPLGLLNIAVKKSTFEYNGTYTENSWKEKTVQLLKNFLPDAALSFGMGRIFRNTHEICLIGTNNNGIYRQLKNKSQRSVSFATNLKHSKKPEALQDSLELMFPSANKIELFARRERPGWICLGNEVGNKEDIRVSLLNILNEQKNTSS